MWQLRKQPILTHLKSHLSLPSYTLSHFEPLVLLLPTCTSNLTQKVQMFKKWITLFPSFLSSISGLDNVFRRSIAHKESYTAY